MAAGVAFGVVTSVPIAAAALVVAIFVALAQQALTQPPDRPSQLTTPRPMSPETKEDACETGSVGKTSW